MKIQGNKSVKNIVVNYEDGSSQVIEKGMASKLEQLDGEVKIESEFTDISRKEMMTLLESVSKVYDKIIEGTKESPGRTLTFNLRGGGIK